MFLKNLLDFIMSLFRPKQVRDKIIISNYPVPGIDYGVLNADQRITMMNILYAGDAGRDRADIPDITQKEFDVVITHIGLYFGSEEICRNIALKRSGWATVNLDLYKQAIVHKAELDTRVDDALSTLYEGMYDDKLKQVSTYIAKHAQYKYGTNSPLDLLADGGMCGAYSMLFYKMATRLGLQAYICYGYASNGIDSGAHAWNMVELGGKHYFYDITFYDGSYNTKYIHSESDWNRIYALNDNTVLRAR